MENIVIRKAVPEDAETILDINIEVWNTTYKDLIPQEVIDMLMHKSEKRIEKYRKSIIENDNFYVAEVDGKIVGFHTYGKTRDEKYADSGEIFAGYILDGYQGLGLGRKLATACMKELLDEGYTTLVTKCLVGNPANEFHKSLGGVYVGQDTFEPRGIYVGKENVYYHDDLAKSYEYNLNRIKQK